jgi:integrase
VKLTQRVVDSITLKGGKLDAVHYDDDLPGFGLRLRAGGWRGFVVQYKTGKKHRRMTIGTTAQVRLDIARRKAADILAAVRLGHDPAGDKQEARARANDSCAPLIQRYLARKQEELRANSYRGTKYALLNLWKPLHAIPIAKVDRRTVAAQLGTLVEVNGPASARRARNVLSAFFAWAMREGLTETNPVIGTSRPYDRGGRERVLSESELAQVWHATGDNHYGAIIKLLILTGLRREEIGGLRWSEVDLSAGLIQLPPRRTKNGRVHFVPLSDPAIALLRVVPHRADGELVFGSGANGPSSYSKSKRALDQRVGPIEPWVLHDLRRSVATHMAELGVQPHIIEAILNHVSGHKAGVAGIYNRATYEPEKRAALDRWADHLLAIVEGRRANVVALAR